MRTMCSNDVQELITIFSTCDVLHKISFFPESCRLHLSVAGVEGGQMLADLNCQPQWKRQQENGGLLIKVLRDRMPIRNIVGRKRNYEKWMPVSWTELISTSRSLSNT